MLDEERRPLYIYRVTRTDKGGGYDSYDSFIVSCHTEEEARKIHPSYIDTIYDEENAS